MRKKLKWISLLTLMIISLAIVPAKAPEDTYTIEIIHPPQVYIDPVLIEDPEATEVTIDIVVSPFLNETQIYNATSHELIDTEYSIIPMEDLWGCQFSVHYNPEVVNGLSKSVNLAFLGSNGATANPIPGAGFDDENGELRLFGMFCVETCPEEDPEIFVEVEEDTVLATVTFSVVGVGVTCFALGDDTVLKDCCGEDFERELHYGTFRNADTELYMGPAKGGKIWPAWKHGFYPEPQILYGRFTSLGAGAVYARIRFTVASAAATENAWSNEVWIEPGETVMVSALYEPPATGDYTVIGEIEFKYDGCLWIDYSEMELMLGGDSTTRDIGTKFWVK